MIYNEKFETMSLENLKEIQSTRLKKMVAYIFENNQFYRERLRNISLQEIQSIDDLSKLPFTTKDDLRDNYPYGLFCLPQDKIAEIHISSGTTGNPTLVGYTKDDLQLWGEVMARCLAAAGAKPGDTIQNAYGYGLFTGGLGFHYGALKLGLTVIPVSSGNTKRQLKLMQDFSPRILTCTPSYALYMLDTAKENNLDPQKSSWAIGVFGAEPWSNNMRQTIEQQWQMSATDIYGLSEIIGPGVAQECSCKQGLHIWSDVFYPEVINPKTGENVAPGQDGELVITTLTKQAIPLIRYRTRDIVCLQTQTCACGRTMPRISKVKGRTDDMLVVRGINIFPSQVEHVLLSIEQVHPHYQIVVDREGNMDTMEIWVELKEQFFSDEIKQLQYFENKIKNELASVLNIQAKIKLVEPKTIERTSGKAKRVIDRRIL